MAIENVPMFKIPVGSDRERWVLIGKLTTNITNRMNGFSVIITGTSDFGGNVPGMDIIQVSTRGVLSFKVYVLIPGSQPVTTYGYRVYGAFTEIWIQEGPHSYEKNCIVTLAKDLYNGDNMEYGVLGQQYVKPSGFTEVTTINRVVTTT